MAQDMTKQEEIESEFENGNKMIRLSREDLQGRAVTIDFPVESLDYIYPSADLISFSQQNERTILFKYLEDMIHLLPEVKTEGVMDNDMVSVLETLLLSLDYLTQEDLLEAPFSDDRQETLTALYAQVFEPLKNSTFLSDAGRPKQNRGVLYVEDGKVYVDDQREKSPGIIYMAVLYKKPEHLMERMRQLGYWISQVRLVPNADKVSFEEMRKGKTNVGIHERTLFFLNSTLRTLAWFLNSTSWRSNELHGFDRVEIASKLGIYR